jgi:hypothetical protein
MTSELSELHLERLKYLRGLQEARQVQIGETARNTDVFAAMGYTPSDRQQLFHDATEYDVFYGGARGGGKTVAVLMEAIRACIRYPGLQVGAFRRTFGELRDNLIKELGMWKYAQAVGATYNGSEYELRFPNGSMIMFRYGESLADATRRQGGQYQLLIIDERTLVVPEVVAFLESNLRSGRRNIPVLGIRSAGNPGGAGHGAVRDRYVEKTEHGQKVYLDEGRRSVRFIPSKASDNPHLDADYHDRLNALPEGLRAAFRDGSWSSFGGQIFTEWRYDRHTVEPFEVPDIWRKHAGLDWGYADPFCVVWGALDSDRRLWVYRNLTSRVDERTVLQWTPEEQAQRVLAAEAITDQNIVRHADPSVWNHNQGVETIWSRWAQSGLLTVPADNHRLPGWMAVHHYLADMPACEIHLAKGWEKCPRMHVMRNCTEVIRTLPDLPYNRRAGQAEDADTHADDHMPDAVRYMIQGVGGTAKPIDVDSWTAPKSRWDTDLRAHSTPWESGSLLTTEF